VTVTVDAPGHTPTVRDLGHLSHLYQPVLEDPDGRNRLGGAWVRSWYGDAAARPGLNKHGLYGVSVGRDGFGPGVETTVVWHHPDDMSRLAQVGPAGWIEHRQWRIPRNEPAALGLSYVNDVSLSGAGYPLHCFTAPLADLMNPAHYRVVRSTDSDIAGTGADLRSGPAWHPTTGDQTTIVLTAADGRYTVRWGDQTPAGNVPIPEPYRGRDCWGIHVIGIAAGVGSPSLVDGEWTGPTVGPSDVHPGVRFDLHVRTL